MEATHLTKRLNERTAVVGIIGLGYVGLPLCAAFVDSGYTVIGFDVNPDTVTHLGQGRSYIRDIPDETIADMVGSGRFTATTDMSQIASVNAVCICVPTPLDALNDPEISFVEAAAQSVATNLVRGQLVVLESTTYPGTTRDVVLPILRSSGLEVGEDFFLAFSPERVDPGNKKYGIRNTPKVIGGIDQTSTDLATALYSAAVDTCVPVDSPEIAEMSKLVENTFRAVNIAFANEIAIMCDKLDIDVWEVIRAASTKPFGFMAFYPGPGVGGHCIPLDPLYLSWKMKSHGYRARFVELANEVNSTMPQYVVEKTLLALNRQRKSVNGSNILIIGVAYKPNIDDIRESPALDIIEELRDLGANVTYYDPYVKNLRVGDSEMDSVALSADSIDCAIIVTNHANVDYAEIIQTAPLVVDTCNAISEMAGNSVVVTL